MKKYKEEIIPLFPTPVYIVKRDSDLDSTEEKELKEIIAGGKKENEEFNSRNSFSNNKYIFKTKFANIKEFCEENIKIYAEKILNPVNEELDFYITQSWLGITTPGENHAPHYHPNSIISGVFYISTEEDDRISFYDVNIKNKSTILIPQKDTNMWNADKYQINVSNNVLVLFPAWLDHSVEKNEKATTDRISLSFNVFVRGNIGSRDHLTELIL